MRNIEIAGAAEQLVAEAALKRGVTFDEAVREALWFYAWAADQVSQGKTLALIEGSRVSVVDWQGYRTHRGIN